MNEISDPVELRRKPMGPARFFAIGIFLFAIKFALDHTIARVVFHQDWSIFNYLIPNEVFTIPTLPVSQRRFDLAMLAIALPFVWIGITITVQRLGDAKMPRWLAALFFLPIINLFFFTVLSVLPSARRKSVISGVETPSARVPMPVIPIALDYGLDDPTPIENSLLGRVLPRSTEGAMLVAIFAPAFMGIGATMLGASVMRNYGLGLFVGMPFFMGMVSAVLFGYRTPRSLSACILVALAATACGGALLILVAIEGLGCLIMFLPLALPIAVLGAIVGYAIQRRPNHYGGSDRSLWSVTALLPAMLVIEGMFPSHAAVIPVTTTVEIDAPPAVVWQNVIAFGRIDVPLDWPSRGSCVPDSSAHRRHGRRRGPLLRVFHRPICRTDSCLGCASLAQILGHKKSAAHDRMEPLSHPSAARE